MAENPDNSTDYPVGFYFSLSFNGEDAAFQQVSGISKELTTEEVASGGENRFKYRLPTAAVSQNLILKRALVPGGTQLINWCASCIDQGFVNNIQTHDVSVNLLNSGGQVCAKWTFHNAYPVKYSVSDLQSQENTLLIESMELAYTYFTISANTTFNNLFN